MPEGKTIIYKEVPFNSSAIDEKNRTIRFLASTPDVDRHGERILPSAFAERLSLFMTNPVFLAAHQHRLDSGEPSVIGRVIRAWIDAAVGLWCIVKFADTPLAERYWQLYKTGFLRACSVGFIEIKSQMELLDGKQVLTFTEVELIELSACAVGSNRGALARSKAAKLDFVQEKRQEREERQYLARAREEYAAQGRDFDAECQEFAEYLLRCEWESGEYFLPDGIEDDNQNEPDYGKRFR